jgi:hypothetical protein
MIYLSMSNGSFDLTLESSPLVRMILASRSPAKTRPYLADLKSSGKLSGFRFFRYYSGPAHPVVADVTIARMTLAHQVTRQAREREKEREVSVGPLGRS